MSVRYKLQTEFFEACSEGDVVGVDSMMRGEEALAKLKDGNEQTGLHMAAANGHDVVVKLLCRNGMKIGERDVEGMKPQHLAFDNGFTSLAVFLRDHDAMQTQDEEEALYEEVASRSATSSTATGITRLYHEVPDNELDLEPSPTRSDYQSEYFYFLVKTPGRPHLSIRLRGNESFSIIKSAVGLKSGEQHTLYHQARELNPAATVGSFGFPLSSPATPLTIEQRPEVVYCKVIDPSSNAHLVKLGYFNPLSRLLNAPGLSEYRHKPCTFLYDSEALDPRQVPGIYNLPCNIENPPTLRMRLENSATSPLRSILK